MKLIGTKKQNASKEIVYQVRWGYISPFYGDSSKVQPGDTVTVIDEDDASQAYTFTIGGVGNKFRIAPSNYCYLYPAK